ncbi:MAG: lytic transglycosylase domain-containing protein [Burkholderiales bacterium]|jgi:soluble lytic murein transglycosylase|nr:lytic transglycosylase domain-containing protein [Burkholderiales bacterium]
MLRLFVFLAAFLPALALADTAARDSAFLAARDAFAKGDAAKLARLAPELRGYILEPYVEYYPLRMRIDEQSPAAIQAFIARYPNTVIGERMRADWLRSLARKRDWDAYLAEYPNYLGDDADLACYALQAAWRRTNTVPTAELAQQWNAPRDIADGCAPIVEAQVAAGRISDRQVWDRLRLLFDAGQLGAAKRTAAYLPAADRPDERTLDFVYANPHRYLEKPRVDVSTREGRELLLLAVIRYARMDAGAAAAHWEPRAEKYAATDRAYVWGQLAAQAARQHRPEALAWYAKADGATLTDDQLGWRARAALREERWPEVKTAIERMTLVGRNDPTWVYWLGRAQLAAGNRVEAETLWSRIAGDPHFYGKLATEELGLRVTVPQKGYTPTPAEVEEMARNEGLQRSLALFRLDLRTEAVREWNWAIRGLDDKQLIAAAEVARRNELWDRAINTADRTQGVHDFGLRFLAPYREVFRDQAAAQGLEEPWVLGLVRQESRFIQNARSSAGAMGLMQLMPATAKYVAKKNGMQGFTLNRTTDVPVNVQLGTSYLRQVLDDLDGSPVLAAAAYNAGPGRAARWRAQRPLEGAIYAESIPFNETRDYVKKVMSNTMYYAAILYGDNRTLKSRLGTIPPKNAERMASAPNGAVE